MEYNITHLHEAVLDYLVDRLDSQSELRFTLRKSNHGSKLDKGFWFDGGNDYLAFSCWADYSWKHKIPEVSFIAHIHKGCWLEINFDENRVDYYADLFSKLNFIFDENKDKLIKHYSNASDIESLHRSLSEFIDEDSAIITKFNRNYIQNNSYKNDVFLNKITKRDFYAMFDRIQHHREKNRELDKQIQNVDFTEKPSLLRSINISNYGPIKHAFIELYKSPKSNDPSRGQWVFITGENGSGKSLVLKAIATFLGYKPFLSSSEFKVQAEVINDEGYVKELQRLGNQDVNKKKRPLVTGLAMYGPMRLGIVSTRISKMSFYDKLSKKKSFGSLFNPDHGTNSKLLNIDKQFRLWENGTTIQRNFLKKRRFYISNLFSEVIPNLIQIDFSDIRDNVTYHFSSSNNSKSSQSWKELSSGNRSMIAMIGDILIRLYDQQREVVDPADLKGIVIIDEIDLHLHPQGQKDIVENLAKAFPEIQFIISTHSPIPFLGAPKGSILYKTTYNADLGVELERLDDKLYLHDLLPNAILTSPIFGMKSIVPVASESYPASIRTETDYNEVELNNKIDQKINDYLDDETERKLIELFEKRNSAE